VRRLAGRQILGVTRCFGVGVVLAGAAPITPCLDRIARNKPQHRRQHRQPMHLTPGTPVSAAAGREGAAEHHDRNFRRIGREPHGKDQSPDLTELSEQMSDIAERSRHLVAEFLKRQAAGDGVGMADPLSIGAAFFKMTARMMSDPSRLVQAQLSLWNDYMTLWQRTAQRFLGGSAEPMIEPSVGDRRFRDKAWTDNTLFDFIKQSYLLTARWLQGTVKDVEGIDERTARKVDFYTRQFVDAIAPSNFLMTNPEVLRATIESRGENLLNGLKNLLDDLERGKGRLAIKMTDMEAFRIGEN